MRASSRVCRNTASSIVSTPRSGQVTRVRPGRIGFGCQFAGLYWRAMPVTSRASLALALVASACGGGGGAQKDSTPTGSPAEGEGELQRAPAPRTEAMLVGPLCRGESCRCRAGDDDAGRPAPGHKRFEIRLGPSDDPLWALVDGMVLFKSRENADACFYVDLKP